MYEFVLDAIVTHLIMLWKLEFVVYVLDVILLLFLIFNDLKYLSMKLRYIGSSDCIFKLISKPQYRNLGMNIILFLIEF